MSVLSHSERDRLVERILDLRTQVEEAEWSGEGFDDDHLLRLRQDLSVVHDKYTQGLPIQELSRCPFSGEILRLAIDDWGLDGAWWDAERPIRPWNEAPPSLLVLSGALRLQGVVESTPHLVKPGPQVPYVAPSMLERPEVVAVISQLDVGLHIGYPIAYYVAPCIDVVPTLNTWGAGRWRSPWDELALELEIIEEETELDADLEPWIRRGKLMWIAPGDGDLRLHATVMGCPYVGLKGSARPSRLMEGRLLELEP
ncbi:MAG: hypothetical protein GY906_09720 [bacterium]|nr:hypothetical protein [bacterium]